MKINKCIICILYSALICLSAVCLINQNLRKTSSEYINEHSTENEISYSIETTSECTTEILPVSELTCTVTTGYLMTAESEQATLDAETETVLAKILYSEARGTESQTEQACIVWTILNRVDREGGGADMITDVALAPNQFSYNEYASTVDDHGRDLKELASDVYERWVREKNGETDVGRVLPSTYYYFHGNGYHNFFREEFISTGEYWDYSLDSPYVS